jgi:hypothetical protein
MHVSFWTQKGILFSCSKEENYCIFKKMNENRNLYASEISQLHKNKHHISSHMRNSGVKKDMKVKGGVPLMWKWKWWMWVDL